MTDSLKLPSRYESLKPEFRGRLRPVPEFISLVQRAFASMKMSGGTRFLPVFGASGLGKTSAARELGTHLPELYVVQLSREAIEAPETLREETSKHIKEARGKQVVLVVDQYEEAAAERNQIPRSFVEQIAILDRNHDYGGVLFIWLTTSRDFQVALQDATSRNRRVLVESDFELTGVEKKLWPQIIEETFRFHNDEQGLEDFEIIHEDLVEIAFNRETLGGAIEDTGTRLAQFTPALQDLSRYRVVMLWPVSDGLRVSRIQQITDARQGYRLDWNAWSRAINEDDRSKLPLKAFNRARLYFDLRLVPIRVADLKPLCRNLDDPNYIPAKSHLDLFQRSHFFSIATNNWSPESYSPLRERESKRATDAKEWYSTVTRQPTKIGRRLSACFNKLGYPSAYEKELRSPHSKIKADIFVDEHAGTKTNTIIEMKAFSAENTMPSTIARAVQVTLKRHAQFAGFISKQ